MVAIRVWQSIETLQGIAAKKRRRQGLGLGSIERASIECLFHCDFRSRDLVPFIHHYTRFFLFVYFMRHGPELTGCRAQMI